MPLLFHVEYDITIRTNFLEKLKEADSFSFYFSYTVTYYSKSSLKILSLKYVFLEFIVHREMFAGKKKEATD